MKISHLQKELDHLARFYPTEYFSGKICFSNNYSYSIWAQCRHNSNQSGAPPADTSTTHNDTKTNDTKTNAQTAGAGQGAGQENYEKDIRERILAASLPHVLELGWSKQALTAGAKDVGYPGITHGLFDRGGFDLIHYFQTTSNTKLVELLKELEKSNKASPLPPPEFVEKALKYRLQMIIPYLSRWPEALAISTLPANVTNTLAALLTAVDDICYYAGDRSVNFQWYARRVGVAGVYKATELYLIQDKSKDHENTWTFLNQRMLEATQLNNLMNSLDMENLLSKDTMTSAFVTARNIIGNNWNR